jgi:catechol 2,3-dioxygenase-like lactoylglutathione lyase family enzyme
VKSAFLMPLLLLSSTAPAQDQRSAPGPIFTTKGAFLAASVADVDASARWYSERLGLRVVMQTPKRDGTRMVALEGGGLLVELIEDDAASPLRQAAPKIALDYRVHGIFKAGVVVDDWDRLVAGLKARGVPIAIGPFPATAEQRSNLLVRDHDGNFIQFFGQYASPGR